MGKIRLSHPTICINCPSFRVIRRHASTTSKTWRSIFEEQAKKHNLAASDWYQMPVNKLDATATQILTREFNGSMYRALSTLFPETEWHPWKFKRAPNSFWEDKSNHKKFFDNLGKELGVEQLDDWYQKLSRKVLIENGGSTLLGIYRGSPMAALMAVYPEHNWTRRKDIGYWKDVSNHRKYFDELGHKIGIQTLDDWYAKLSKSVVLQNDGVSVVNQYKGSAMSALMASYPEHKWVLWKFKSVPQGFWKDLENQRNFLEDLGKKMGIKTLDDWYQKLSASVIEAHGGSGLLSRYKQSPQAALMAVYPEHKWVPWKFNTVPSNFWESKDNISTFLSDLSEKLSIQTLDDWYRVDYVQLSRFHAASLIMRYKGLYQVLKEQYPHHPWDEKKFQQKGRKAQRWLLVTLQKMFPDEELLEDYMHPKAVSPSSNRPLQLDIFMPSRSLAFEYQGKQHYQEVGVFSPQSTYQFRDEEKRALCAANNIKMIEVPYWWNRTQESLEQIIEKS